MEGFSLFAVHISLPCTFLRTKGFFMHKYLVGVSLRWTLCLGRSRRLTNPLLLLSLSLSLTSSPLLVVLLFSPYLSISPPPTHVSFPLLCSSPSSRLLLRSSPSQMISFSRPLFLFPTPLTFSSPLLPVLSPSFLLPSPSHSCLFGSSLASPWLLVSSSHPLLLASALLLHSSAPPLHLHPASPPCLLSSSQLLCS